MKGKETYVAQRRTGRHRHVRHEAPTYNKF